MRNRNSVRQLGRTYSHRKAMFNNLVTSLFEHERVVTTKEKAKEARKLAEKMITRAKLNLDLQEGDAKAVHNKREILKRINDRSVMVKLFNDIAPRCKERNGGYTRILLLGKRQGDSAEMAILELVDKKVEVPAEEPKDKKSKKK